MTECGYPSVYVVDSHANRPPIPPRLNQRRRSSGVAQPLLFLLVTLALCGMIIEACFIYRLYPTQPDTSSMPSKIIGDKGVTSPFKGRRPVVPSKPVAHLTGGPDAIHGKEILAWSMEPEPLLYKMKYENKCLIIQKEGFYYVYAKVAFFKKESFRHSIELKTKLYMGKSIPLLMSREYSDDSHHRQLVQQSSSYLGGVFHLVKDDALFVKVNDNSSVVRHQYSENSFGAYML